MKDKEKLLRIKVRRFADDKLRPIAMDVDELDDISWEVVRLLAEAELFKYLIPTEYGGLGVECVNLCIIREELARGCIQSDDTFAMSGIGSYPIIKFGTEKQKTKYLPSIVKGNKIASFALTEPRHGSDIANLETLAVREGDHYQITGTKCFASNAAGAEICPVFVRTGPEKGPKGLSTFIVNVKNSGPGLTCKGMKLMGPHPAYELIFDHYPVSKEDLLGDLGMGMKIALSNLNMWRVTVGAASTGMACAAYEEALRYSQKRLAFGKPIIEFQVLQFKLAEMATKIEAARTFILDVARRRDEGLDEKEMIKFSSMAKLFATEAAQKVVDEALQIHGGWGLVRSARIQQLYRAVRSPRIYEGTSEIQALTIARAIQKEARDV